MQLLKSLRWNANTDVYKNQKDVKLILKGKKSIAEQYTAFGQRMVGRCISLLFFNIFL